MKMFATLSALAALTLTACGASNQQSNLASEPAVSRSISADLTVLNLDPQLSVGSNFGGHVQIDLTRKNIFVQISTCPPNAMCVWAGPSYTAELVSEETDSCGATHYVARTDRRPVDGALVEITVHDYSKLVCRIFRPHHTVVELKTTYITRMETQEVTTYSELKGLAGLR